MVQIASLRLTLSDGRTVLVFPGGGGPKDKTDPKVEVGKFVRGQPPYDGDWIEIEEPGSGQFVQKSSVVNVAPYYWTPG